MLSRLYLLRSYQRSLGFWLGLRYWLISNRCAKDPQLVLKWADKCQRAGSQALAEGDNIKGNVMLDWAEELRASHAAFTLQKYTPRRRLKRAAKAQKAFKKAVARTRGVRVAAKSQSPIVGQRRASANGQKSRNGAK